jgi:hypothetical protein
MRHLAVSTESGVVGKHAFRALFYICSVMGPDNKAKVDQQKLAERLGVSGQTLYMATRALCSYGFIAKEMNRERSKTFIVNPALAVHDDGVDYETIMEAFSKAQADQIEVEQEENKDVEEAIASFITGEEPDAANPEA